jgi:alpha-tubulin suppressor-like RCC1 family protein
MSLTGATSLGLGDDHACAVTAAAGVVCWGDNGFGSIGDGTSGSGNHRATPTAVRDLTQVVEVDGGGDFSCARRSNGEVWCWGRGTRGELGNGSMVDSPVPVRVSLPVAASALGLGQRHACARGVDGHLYCWGEAGNGAVGDGGSTTTRAVTTPVRVVPPLD